MSTLHPPGSTGFRRLFDLILAAGGQPAADGTVPLPSSLGTGTVQVVDPEPGLTLALYHCTLTQALTLNRPAETTLPDTWLLTFTTFSAGTAAPPRPVPSVQITSSAIAFTTTLPAQTPLFMVGVAITKSLLLSWLNPADGPLPAVLTASHPVVLDTLLTPEIQLVLTQLAEPRTRPYQNSFFYKVKAQELLYFLLVELAHRAASPRYLHAADVEKVFQARTALLATWQTPLSLARIAAQVGLRAPVLQQLFQQVFGTSLYQYFQAARLEEAKRLLQHYSVSEVGYQLGFTNLSHFARLFKKHYGLTPKKYQTTRLAIGGPPDKA
jgi:AraC-like DNA-binding protein